MRRPYDRLKFADSVYRVNAPPSESRRIENAPRCRHEEKLVRVWAAQLARTLPTSPRTSANRSRQFTGRPRKRSGETVEEHYKHDVILPAILLVSPEDKHLISNFPSCAFLIKPI